ncbi:hypothetical protein [Criblamydia sequanensis]|uniref:Uncharacterized protein n=1 Tax=Candidatus Criblamydia sequanensis CRIB-18 TaxID=1437425 RepID=A0A090D053_9BACT|nr:hypothetical protein [Criblamydia sequanensis]CDR34666.1 hypothetical protein CSEC_1858 [Criblamydia sequanensis CRIB-18]
MVHRVSSLDYNWVQESQRIEKESGKESLVVSVFNSMISEFKKTERAIALYRENALNQKKEFKCCQLNAFFNLCVTHLNTEKNEENLEDLADSHHRMIFALGEAKENWQVNKIFNFSKIVFFEALKEFDFEDLDELETNCDPSLYEFKRVIQEVKEEKIREIKRLDGSHEEESLLENITQCFKSLFTFCI